MTVNRRGNRLSVPKKHIDPKHKDNWEAIERWANTQVVNQVIAGTGVTITTLPLSIGPGAQGTGIATINAATSTPVQMIATSYTSIFTWTLGSAFQFQPLPLPTHTGSSASVPQLQYAASDFPLQGLSFTSGPVFHTGTAGFIQVSVWNTASSQAIQITATGITITPSYVMQASDFTITTHVGADLQLIGGNAQIQTTAGGVYGMHIYCYAASAF